MEDEATKEFRELVEPVIKWMAENVHPHHTLIITSFEAELLEGQRTHTTTKFIKD